MDPIPCQIRMIPTNPHPQRHQPFRPRDALRWNCSAATVIDPCLICSATFDGALVGVCRPVGNRSMTGEASFGVGYSTGGLTSRFLRRNRQADTTVVGGRSTSPGRSRASAQTHTRPRHTAPSHPRQGQARSLPLFIVKGSGSTRWTPGHSGSSNRTRTGRPGVLTLAGWNPGNSYLRPPPHQPQSKKGPAMR